jgi:hypothetical protein
MKSPPVQYTDAKAHAETEKFIAENALSAGEAKK